MAKTDRPVKPTGMAFCQDADGCKHVRATFRRLTDQRIRRMLEVPGVPCRFCRYDLELELYLRENGV